MVFATLFLIPAIVALCFMIIFGRRWSFTEFLVHIGIQVIVATICVWCMYSSNTADHEIWNGRVVSKTRDVVSCEHSYTCNCVTTCTGGKNSTCTTVCQTCYEHSYDVSWYLHTSNRESIYIDRVSRQGLVMPSRWRTASVGDFTALTHPYTNYIKAAPDSLFRHHGLKQKYAAGLPAYPSHIYDYHYVNRFVAVGISVPDSALWNRDLMRINSELGAPKQVNMIIVVTKNRPQEYFYALEEAWMGGKKNDVILVIDIDDNLKMNWVAVMAWSDNPMIKVSLREDVAAIGDLSKRDAIISSLSEDVGAAYKRKHMKDFKYLMSSITPSKSAWIWAMMIGIVASIITGLMLPKLEVFQSNDNDQPSYRRKYR